MSEKTTDAVKILHKLYIKGKPVPRERVLECEREIAELEVALSSYRTWIFGRPEGREFLAKMDGCSVDDVKLR